MKEKSPGNYILPAMLFVTKRKKKKFLETKILPPGELHHCT